MTLVAYSSNAMIQRGKPAPPRALKNLISITAVQPLQKQWFKGKAYVGKLSDACKPCAVHQSKRSHPLSCPIPPTLQEGPCPVRMVVSLRHKQGCNARCIYQRGPATTTRSSTPSSPLPVGSASPARPRSHHPSHRRRRSFSNTGNNIASQRNNVGGGGSGSSEHKLH